MHPCAQGARFPSWTCSRDRFTRPVYATSSQKRSIACRDATTAVLATFLRLFDMHQTLSIARIYTRRPREAATDAS